VVQQLPVGYVFDPEDPRAPSVEQWDRMRPEERDRVVAMLPPAERLAEDLALKLAEEQRLREDEQRLREEVEGQLAEARAEIERLKGKGA
jgi:hypothetical protein